MVGDFIGSEKPYVRRKVLVPVTVVVLGIILLFSVFGYIVLNRYLVYKVNHELEEVDSLFERLLASESRGLQAQLSLLSKDPELLAAWKAKNRDTLESVAGPLFAELQANSEVTHLYFIAPESRCFLRAHAPERYGDEIDRFTLAEAVKNGQPASGIELGVYGTFTLRCVRPWIVDGELIGYLELGEEISHLTPQLQWVTRLDVVFTIEKEHLDKEDWLTGDRFLNKHSQWDAFEKFVVIDSSFAGLHDPVKAYLSGPPAAMTPAEVLDGSKTYRMTYMPLTDASGEVVGKLFVAYDVTDLLSGFRRALTMATLIALASGLLLLAAFYAYLGRLDLELGAYRLNLEGVVQRRTEELEEALSSVKKLSGTIPICSSCKKIRNGDGQWKMLEIYISQHTDATFDHCVCDDCLSTKFPNVDRIRTGTDKLDQLSDEER